MSYSSLTRMSDLPKDPHYSVRLTDNWFKWLIWTNRYENLCEFRRNNGPNSIVPLCADQQLMFVYLWLISYSRWQRNAKLVYCDRFLFVAACLIRTLCLMFICVLNCLPVNVSRKRWLSCQNGRKTSIVAVQKSQKSRLLDDREEN